MHAGGPGRGGARGWSGSVPSRTGGLLGEPRRAGVGPAAELRGLPRPTQCLDCHRPNAADPSPGYHPAGFLTTHPAAAYTRDQSCADCHNQSQFCANCHLNAGLGSRDGLRGAGYHDAKAEFLLNHGQAARQNLESCVSCHSERTA